MEKFIKRIAGIRITSIDHTSVRFKRGIEIESRKHPSFTPWQIEQIVEDHIKEDQKAYL